MPEVQKPLQGEKDPWSGCNLYADTDEVRQAWEAESMVLGREKMGPFFLGL